MTRCLAAIALAVAACAVYGSALQSPFVYDDAASVIRNSSITHLWPLVGDAEHPAALSPPKDRPTSGRPLVNLTLAINYSIGQLNPVGYHVFNLMVHVLSAWLLMAIVRRTLELDYFEGRFQSASGVLAFAVALLWAVHPLQTEAVVYVTQRTELMVAFFYLATLYACLRYWGAKSAASRRIWLALATVASLAGMACKEVMVAAPAMVLLFERTFIAGSFRGAFKKSWPLYLGLAASWGLLVGLNLSAPRSHTAGFQLGIPAYAWWFTQAKVLWMYLKLIVWPWPQSISYYLPYLITFQQSWPWLVATALLILATLVLSWRRTAVGFVGAWVLLILLPTLIVPIVTEVAAERRMYLPLAAIVALVVVGGFALAQRARMRSALAATAIVAMLLAVVLSLISFQRLAVYRDDLTLWQDVLASQPKNFVAHYNLGLQLAHQHRTQEAMDEYQYAIALAPDYADPHNNLGNILLAQGRVPEAIACYEEALRLNPDYAQAHNNLGTALANMGKIAEAIDQYHEAIRINSDFGEAYGNLGNVLLQLNRPQDAIQPLQHAVQLLPNSPKALYILATAYAQLNRFPEATEAAQQALDLARSSGRADLVGPIELALKYYRAGQATSDDKASSAPGDGVGP